MDSSPAYQNGYGRERKLTLGCGSIPLRRPRVRGLEEREEGWQAEWRKWKRRSLEGLQVACLWVDGVYVEAGLEKDKAALLVVIGGLLDGRKTVLAVEPDYQESTESWSEVLRDLKERGMNCPCLVVGTAILASGAHWRTFIRQLSNSVAGTTKWLTCWTSSQRSSKARPKGI